MILHLCAESAWQHAQMNGEYRAESLDTEGFIHCSLREQVAASANRYYAGRQDMALLVIDPDKVRAEVRYERASNNELYPHIYGPLNLDAVMEVRPYSPDANGAFAMPKFAGEDGEIHDSGA